MALAAMAFFGWPKAKSRYQRWNAGRQLQHAADSIAQGDFRRAMLDARAALEVNPMDPEATRIMAQALEGAGAAPSAAQWRNRLDTLRPGDMENTLAWASDSLKAGDLAAAERILAMLRPEPVNNVTYHATAAAVAMAKGDTAGAELHWAGAARLDPQEDRYQLQLALLRIGSKNSELRAGAVEILTAISRKPPNHLNALRALLADATLRREWPRAAKLAGELVAGPGAVFEDKLRRLEVLRAMNAPGASAFLVELKDGALANPGDLYLLFMWMSQQHLALMVAEWAETLSPDVTGTPPVCAAVADAYARISEWKKLRDFLDARTWGDLEYLRRMFLSGALERLGDSGRAAQEWNDALSAARSREDARQRLERMAKTCVSWEWGPQAEEVMRILAGMPDCPRWVLDNLWKMTLARADTVQLQKLAGLLAQADSKSTVFRNHYAFFSLLVRSEDGSPHREAEKLFEENPGNAAIAVTRGLSLFQQGKAAQALAATAALPSEELQKPDVALYHAIFLTATGGSEQAAGFLAVAQKRKMFPEEMALLERAKLMVATAADEKAVAEAAIAARAARAAWTAEADAAVEAARTARAAKAAEPPKDADEKEIAATVKIRMAERAVRTAESDAAVEAARAARAAAKAAEAAKPAPR